MSRPDQEFQNCRQHPVNRPLPDRLSIRRCPRVPGRPESRSGPSAPKVRSDPPDREGRRCPDLPSHRSGRLGRSGRLDRLHQDRLKFIFYYLNAAIIVVFMMFIGIDRFKLDRDRSPTFRSAQTGPTHGARRTGQALHSGVAGRSVQTRRSRGALEACKRVDIDYCNSNYIR